jgi:acyl-coenzyme A synthetase/AMP-(fatty) acid ligase
VEVSHGNAVNLLSSMAESPGLSMDDRFLAVTTLSFDISVFEIFGPLSKGGQVILAPAELASNGDRLRALLEESEANSFQATPATWRMLLDAGWEGARELRVMAGGEAFPPELARDLLSRCGEVWNMYGPTEVTVYSIIQKVEEVKGAVPIGRPIHNTQVYVLDAAMKPVPVGVPGELFIGGASVARGYRGRPDLTAQQFVPDPFSDDPAARLYRTGDLGRFRADGVVEYLGRLDNQVKIRGFRIEPEEIESALARHEAIRQVVVHPQGEGLEKRLVAYVVFEPGHGLTSTEIRRFLRSRLPAYMIPNLVVELPELPLTSSGKVDRKALPGTEVTASRPSGSGSPPQTPEEKLIGEIWKALLKVEKVDREDNFYDLGGHSLLSIRAAAEIERKTGKKAHPRSMFFQTLEQLAQELTERG